MIPHRLSRGKDRAGRRLTWGFNGVSEIKRLGVRDLAGPSKTSGGYSKYPVPPFYLRAHCAHGRNLKPFPMPVRTQKKEKHVMKWIIRCFLLNLLLFPLDAGAKSFYSDGTVDNSSGTPNKDLVYRDFDITQDGYVTGCITNKSNHPLKSVRLDMWTTNRAETAILWRKTLTIGDMAPQGKYEVREP